MFILTLSIVLVQINWMASTCHEFLLWKILPYILILLGQICSSKLIYSNWFFLWKTRFCTGYIIWTWCQTPNILNYFFRYNISWFVWLFPNTTSELEGHLFLTPHNGKLIKQQIIFSKRLWRLLFYIVLFSNQMQAQDPFHNLR